VPYRLAADLVVVLHFAFVAFVALGGLLVRRFRRAAWLHLPAAAWGAAIELTGLVCPLTPLEKWLRERGGEEIYAGGFIQHYIVPVLYPPGLTRAGQVALGCLLVAANALLYWRAFRR
jgi:hypothetical protein